MKELAHKWFNRVVWVFAGLLTVYCAVKLGDSLWYRTHIPVGFQNANWSGTWQTKQYFSLSGRLLVRLPDPLPENKDFKPKH